MPRIKHKANRDDTQKSSSISHIFKYTYVFLPELIERYDVKMLKIKRAEVMMLCRCCRKLLAKYRH